MKMSDVFDGDVVDINLFQDSCYIDTDEADYEIEDSEVKDRVIHAINNHDRMTDEIAELRAKIAKKDEVISGLIEALGASVDDASELRVVNKKLLQQLCDIQGECIGEIAMGYNLCAEQMGQSISMTTGMTHPELMKYLVDLNK